MPGATERAFRAKLEIYEFATHKRAEIGRALSGSIADQQLMLEKQGLCSDGAGATWVKEFRESDDQMNDEDEQFAHGANATTIGLAGKTAQKARFERQSINSPSTGV